MASSLLASPASGGPAAGAEAPQYRGLDVPPPAPPGVGSKPSLLAGPGASGPHSQALMGLAMMDKGAQLLSAILPGIGPAIGDMISNLKQAVPQALMAMNTGPLLNPQQNEANVPATPPAEV